MAMSLSLHLNLLDAIASALAKQAFSSFMLWVPIEHGWLHLRGCTNWHATLMQWGGKLIEAR